MIAARLKAGAHWNEMYAAPRVSHSEMIAASQDLYQAQHETEPYRDVTVTRDEKYGAHERQRLDVFQPVGNGGKRPVLVYVHGGGFIAGNKRVPGTAYYDNVGLWAVRNGYVGVTMTYRLAPENKYPAAAADVGGAVKWVIEHIAAQGGDPDNIVLLGQSAGSTHVATYAARPELHPRNGGGVRAIGHPADVRYLRIRSADVSPASACAGRSRLRANEALPERAVSAAPQPHFADRASQRGRNG